jgi:hypothetical protein
MVIQRSGFAGVSPRAFDRSARASSSGGQYSAALQAAIERRERKQAEEEKARAEAARAAQQEAAQFRRDKRQQQYEQQNTAQRGFIASDAAAQSNRYTTLRDQQQTKDTLKRDSLQARLMAERDREQAREQALRDQRQFGFATQENQQQFGNQMQRDAMQQGYATERDMMQQGHTLQRDYMQSGIQAQRDQRLNEFDAMRDERQQGYTQQNMYQRETAEISARWQEQVQQLRNSGMDFSEAQKKEMNILDATFRKNVLNNPDLDEGLKQAAMLQHQRKLAGIIPDERVQDPKQNLDQSLMFHEPTKSWYMMRPDSQGRPTFEPLGGGEDSGMKAQQQAEQKQVEQKRTATAKRLDEFENLVNKLETTLNDKDERAYKTREDAVKAAMDIFAAKEDYYRSEYDLPPLWAFQKEADEVRAKEEEKLLNQQKNKPVPVNPYRQPQPALPQDGGMAGSLQLRSGDGTLPQTPAGSQKPTATNIDEKIQQTAAKGDAEGNAALEVIKRVTAKGPPKPGTPEFQYLMDAYRIIQKNGISIDDMKKPPGRDIVPPYGGDFYAF